MWNTLNQVKFVFFLMVLNSCQPPGNGKSATSTKDIEEPSTSNIPQKADTGLSASGNAILQTSKFKKEDIARYAIAAIMHQSPGIVKAKQSGAVYLISYVRPADNQKLSYKIKFGDNHEIIWGDSNGRWKDAYLDEKIKYIENGEQVTILQIFEDGSKAVHDFKNGD